MPLAIAESDSATTMNAEKIGQFLAVNNRNGCHKSACQRQPSENLEDSNR